MRSDLTTSQRVTLQTESAQSNQGVRVLPAMQAYFFLFFVLSWMKWGGGIAGQKVLVFMFALPEQHN